MDGIRFAPGYSVEQTVEDLFRSSSDSEGSDAEDDGTETQVDQSDEICLHELEENDILAENDDSGEDESAVLVSSGRDIAWSTKEPSIRRFPVRNIQRFSAGIPSTVSVSSAVDCCKQFITNELLDIIVQFTNQRGNELKVSGKLVDWRDTDRCELLSFLGLLILYGVQKSRGKYIDEFWEFEYGTPPFRATMSRRRYQDILRSLRFDDRITRLERKEKTGNKAEAVQEIFDLFAVQSQTSFIPSSNVTVDEHLCVYRGRCSFNVYIPSKPGKYSIKIWCAVDCEHGYLTNLQMYTGRSGDVREVNQGKRVVLDLVRHLAGSGGNITTDNFSRAMTLAKNC
ncbi:piggyBac transposable element-derived protein 4-like [Schistocerca piceifrons]|uniref:piggyBac transposable element-derived protein 4-like n=1 Tax=Schistocerca piceifrons TaxID=274613 RepID=UPI001F5F2601|nr:piggyBac transposable element-derived protein 4-like [Schistocerca piceifrons]